MKEETEVREIAFDDLCLGRTQTRAKIRPHVVKEYARAMRKGATFPPGVAYDDGSHLWPASGFHRMEARKLAGHGGMRFEVRPGTRLDAILFGAKDNIRHRGERLTRADKQHAVRLVLQEDHKMSDRDVAKACGVDHRTVGRIRKKLVSTGEVPQSRTRVGADGREIDTTSIGSRPGRAETHQPVDDQPPTASPEDRCACGNHWTNDGEGGRFCEVCGADHPENSVGAPATTAEPGHPAEVDHSQEDRMPQSARSAEKLFDDCTAALGVLKRSIDRVKECRPGSKYEICLGIARKLGDELAAWKREGQPDAVTDADVAF